MAEREPRDLIFYESRRRWSLGLMGLGILFIISELVLSLFVDPFEPRASVWGFIFILVNLVLGLREHVKLKAARRSATLPLTAQDP